MEPKQIQGRGKTAEFRLDLHRHSFSYEWGSTYPKEYKKVAEGVVKSSLEYIKEGDMKGSRFFKPFDEIARRTPTAKPSEQSTKIIFSRFGYSTPLNLPVCREQYLKANVQFTIHKDNSHFPLKGFKGSKALFSLVDRPTILEGAPKTFKWDGPFEFVLGGTGKVTITDNNRLVILRLLSQENEGLSPAEGEIMGTPTQNVYYTPDYVLKDIYQRQIASENQLSQNVYTSDQRDLLRNIYQRQIASENQVSQNQREICSRLENLRTENHFVFKETLGAIRDLDRSSYTASEELKGLVKSGEEAESSCCYETKPMIRELSDDIAQPNHPELFLQAFLGSTFYQALRSIVRSLVQGFAICLLIGGMFSVLYFVADVYVFHYHQKRGKDTIRLALYLVANLVRFAFPFGICSSYILLLAFAMQRTRYPS